MSHKSIIFAFLFSFLLSFQTSAAAKFPNQGVHTEVQSNTCQQQSYKSEIVRSWQQQDRVPDRVSFSTRSGFVLLRKEEIISMSIRKLYGGILLQYWSRGEVKTIVCHSTISDAMKKLGDFPFLKVSRSAIVNIDQVAEYVGTRRDAQLRMKDGTMVNVSRNRAGDIYDWIIG